MRTSVVVIGAGQSGLAMSCRLRDLSIDHVVLERREVAASWLYDRWDGLRLLTPNHQCRLPGLDYSGDDPDGYLSAGEVASFIRRYAEFVDAPVRTGVGVRCVTQAARGPAPYRVETDQGTWLADAVVVATGWAAAPRMPASAGCVDRSVTSVIPGRYTGPDDLADGGVLVVGASATGVQLADEIHRSGRPVTLAVGEHVRMPRRHRDRDIFWWLEAAGVLAERYDEVDDLTRARRLPSPQLVGSPAHRDLDLNALTGIGVRLVGRLAGVEGRLVRCAGSLVNVCALADLKQARLLRRLDAWATKAGLGIDPDCPTPSPTMVEADPRLELNLRAEGIRTVVWATGFGPDHSWLDVPVRDRAGRVVHDGGVVRHAPGLVLLGAPLLRRRSSSYLMGAADDTRELADHLRVQLDIVSRTTPPPRPAR